jgi:hypothetical protein
MERKMEPLEVSTREGRIYIAQDYGSPSDDASPILIITVEQVPILIGWLQEAAQELQKTS